MILRRSVVLSRLVAGRYDEVTRRKVSELGTRQTNSTMPTTMRTVVASTAATGIVAPSTVSIIASPAPSVAGTTTLGIDSAGAGNVVMDNDDDGRPWGGPPLFVATTNKAT